MQWEKHLEGLKMLGVLANQAVEFETSSTEGKTIIKPDLISCKTIQDSLLGSPIKSPEEEVNLLKKIDISASNTSLASQKSDIRSVSPNKSEKSFRLSPQTTPLSTRRSIEVSKPVVVSYHSSTNNLESAKLDGAKLESSKPEIITKVDVAQVEATIAIEAIAIEADKPKDPHIEKVEDLKVSNSVTEAVQVTASTSVETVVIDKASIPVKISESKPTSDASSVNKTEASNVKSIESIKKVEPATTEVSDASKPTAKPELANISSKEAATISNGGSKILEKPTLTASNKEVSSVPSSTVSGAIRPSLKRTKKGGAIVDAKPPNILVYSESNTTKENVVQTLKSVLEDDMYTIYPLGPQDVKNNAWIDHTTLLVVCGNVPADIAKILLDFFIKGGKMLCLCSDVLHIVLPTFRMAEIREHELVQFSYGKWKKVKMMHHIFCYQPSPVKKQFSSVDGEDIPPPKKP